MNGKNVPLQYVRGDDVFWKLNFLDKATKTPIDLTGYTVNFTIKQSLKDSQANAILAKEYTSIVDPELGAVVIDISHNDGVETGDYYYDVQLTDSGNLVSTPIMGKIKVIQDTTTDE